MSANASDVLKVLVCGDVHLGFKEDDAIRGMDSFTTFDEVFMTATEHKVDLVLMTGNVFHDNKPSRKAMQHAIETLRDHCLGDGDVGLEIVSDQATNFHGRYGSVNYADPNFNVQLPVFAIHGNHDEPGGSGGLSALDILASANLINYFGQSKSAEKISIAPVLIRKGATKLALYGLGHVRDEDLATALDKGAVKVGTPKEEETEWFNVLAIHQKRAKGSGSITSGAKSIAESRLPHDPVKMDLVVWGHEHQCQIIGGMGSLKEIKKGSTFQVIQPGSIIATEFVETEADHKHLGILHLWKDKWRLESVPLQTMRPFKCKEVILAEFEEEYDLRTDEALMDFLSSQIEDMLDELKADNPTVGLTEQAENRHNFPIIRLRVDHTGYSTCNPQRFGQRFVDRVANPSDLLQFFRKAKRTEAKEDEQGKKPKKQAGFNGAATADEVPAQIQELVTDFLGSNARAQLRLIDERVFHKAIFEDFVKKEDKGAIEANINKALEQQQKLLYKETEEGIGGTSKDQQDKIEQIVREKAQAAGAAGGGAAGSSGAAADEDDEDDGGGGGGSGGAAGGGDDDDDDDDMDVGGFDAFAREDTGGGAAKSSGAARSKQPAAPAAPAGRGRGRGRGKAPAAPAARGRGRGKAAASAIELSDDEEETARRVVFDEIEDDDDDGVEETVQAPAARKSAARAPAKRAAPAGSRAGASKRARAAEAPTYDDDDDDDDDDDGGDYQETSRPTAEPSDASKRSFGSRRRMR